MGLLLIVLHLHGEKRCSFIHLHGSCCYDCVSVLHQILRDALLVQSLMEMLLLKVSSLLVRLMLLILNSGLMLADRLCTLI